ncbi:acyl-CoA dehydratase activase-related protein [Natranaerofaba carboxydovora]|uniref:acyl-CoA dehydratase activase-related protein n=1 Tax=Natranaerofaba carboxydovora TaxID=2742683 RepID=UPI001F13AA06|nr:acyl-CoA dehydratase activase-related protein [Natranaerofaba carboxydovora]UMZ72597.1 hypothetical protein ACONDI_00121 [Natranaerofaba carboxydovora]
MKIAFPHMGNISVMGKTLFENLGHEVIVPPKNTKRTLELGTTYAPEFACFPLKVTLGNFIEAAEKGADTIFMAGGGGPCRFGLYGHIQKEILNDLGYDIDAVIIDPPVVSISDMLSKIWKVKNGSSIKNTKTALQKAWAKMHVLDYLDKKLSKTRPYEIISSKNKDGCDNIKDQIVKMVDKEEDLNKIYQVKEEIDHRIDNLSLAPRPKNPVQVAIVGEIYMVLESFANFDIEKRLGEMGCEVKRSVYLSEWVSQNIHPLGRQKYKQKKKKIEEKAKPYIKHFVGGHGRESIGEAVIYAGEGYDGIIHVAPFTCMPETTAQSVFPIVSEDFNLPVLSMIFDEQTGEAGTVTRLEAFTDLIKRKRKTA